MRQLIRDLIAIARQLLALPYNKATWQVRRSKKRHYSNGLSRHRVEVLSTLASHAAIASYCDAFASTWARFEHANAWNARGASGMSVDDQMSLYALVRCLEPRTCVETGVGGGTSSVCILRGSSDVGGKLYSIDIAHRDELMYGHLIPADLRSRWQMIIQRGVPLLPQLLKELGSVDLFLHDSRHHHVHMMWEYSVAWQRLRAGGCLASHDILTTSSFDDFFASHQKTIKNCGRIGNFGFFIKD